MIWLLVSSIITISNFLLCSFKRVVKDLFLMDSNLLKCLYTIVAKSGGFLFKPWITGRDKESELVWKGVEKLFDIQIEKQAQLLKQDETNTNIDIKYLKKIATHCSNDIDQEDKSKKEPYLECYNNIRNGLAENIIHREFRKEVNFAKAIDIAADILSQDNSEPPKEQVEQDWLYRFREVASNTTTEEIQQLWGRILAGEIKSPGKHSLRTLEFIKNLSQKEAKQIEKLFSFVLNDRYVANNCNQFLDYKQEELNLKLLFTYLPDMQSLGIIYDLSECLLMEQLNQSSEEINTYQIKFGKRDSLFFIHDKNDDLLSIRMYTLTKLGLELYDLCEVDVNKDYVNYIIESLEEQGFKKNPTI